MALKTQTIIEAGYGDLAAGVTIQNGVGVFAIANTNRGKKYKVGAEVGKIKLNKFNADIVCYFNNVASVNAWIAQLKLIKEEMEKSNGY